jgi:hypothetical protein
VPVPTFLRRGLRRLVVPVVALAAIGFGATACTPDTTRARVENDVSQSFANSYELSEQLQGNPTTHPDVTSTECHSGVNPKQDSGPGGWNCDISYVADGKPSKASLLVLIDQLGCYQAIDTSNRDATITDKDTGAVLPDPKVGFDGCYDVYDDRTSVSNK